jgi:hypothetical protein
MNSGHTRCPEFGEVGLKLKLDVRALLAALRGRDHGQDRAEQLGDFTTTWRVVPISGLAIGIGIFAAFVALALLKLIGFFTNLFFFQRVSTALVSPAGNRLGWLELFVPVIGALVIGLMARYGSNAYAATVSPRQSRPFCSRAARWSRVWRS